MISLRSSDEKCPHEDCGLSCTEYYELIRVQVHHEDELINNRLSWLIQSQTIFIAAYAVIITSPYGASLTDSFFAVFRGILILVGLAVTIIVLIAVLAALSVMKQSVDLLKTHCPRARRDYDGLLPILTLSDRVHGNGLKPANFFPVTFLVAWVMLGVPFLAEVMGALTQHLKA